MHHCFNTIIYSSFLSFNISNSGWSQF